MSLQGPIVVVAERPVPVLLDALAAAGAFPVVETRAANAIAAVASIRPAALILAADGSMDPAAAGALAQAAAAAPGPFIPIIACIDDGAAPPCPQALPVARNAPPARLIARLRSALRVRALHGSVLRRAETLDDPGIAVADLLAGDPLDEATVLVAGRGGAYPALTGAIGARMGLIGALSVETAKSFLKARDIDAVVIGDGFNRRVIAAFLAELAADARFRDLPVALLADVAAQLDPERLPNLTVARDPARIADHIAPLARLHAFAARLRRMMAALDGKGVLDPDTGLRTCEAFLRDLARAVDDAEERGVALSLARFSLDNLRDRRASLDAARIIARLVRYVDFGCRDADGTILLAFTETDLRTAHVVARRVASVLKHTAIAPGYDQRSLDPAVTIAALRSRDTAATLIARVGSEGLVAAS